jgi:hypothetical protein
VFIFGHLGFGRTLVTRWHHRLPWLALAVGILLPDMIDKPLYYSGITGFFSCTRTVGHTGLLALAFCGTGWLRHIPALLALGTGMATHIVIDIAFELLTEGRVGSAWIAATWPLHGPSFDRVTFTLTEHLGRITTWPILVFEALGLLLLLLEAKRAATSGGRRPTVRTQRASHIDLEAGSEP